LELKYDDGERPRKNPALTMDAAAREGVPGILRVWIADAAIVKGRIRPRAICGKD